MVVVEPFWWWALGERSGESLLSIIPLDMAGRCVGRVGGEGGWTCMYYVGGYSGYLSAGASLLSSFLFYAVLLPRCAVYSRVQPRHPALGSFASMPGRLLALGRASWVYIILQIAASRCYIYSFSAVGIVGPRTGGEFVCPVRRSPYLSCRCSAARGMEMLFAFM